MCSAACERACSSKSYLENCADLQPGAGAAGDSRDGGIRHRQVHRHVARQKDQDVISTDLSHAYSGKPKFDGNNRGFFDQACCVCPATRSSKVNQQYIRIGRPRRQVPHRTTDSSLQGSYRNMNKLAEKLASAMTADEVEQLLDDHYLGEAQTLTTEAEFNLLKLGEMRGRLTDEQRARFDEIVGEYRRQKRLGGGDADPVTRITATLDSVRDSLEAIRAALGNGAGSEVGAELRAIAQSLSRDVSVTVENQPPPGVRDILAQQVALVEKTLVPVVNAATKNLHDGQMFAQQLMQIFEALQSLEHKLE